MEIIKIQIGRAPPVVIKQKLLVQRVIIAILTHFMALSNPSQAAQSLEHSLSEWSFFDPDFS